MADLLKLGGLWKNTSANGDVYLQGKISPGVKILIFKNKFKTEENQPDYELYFAPVERKDTDGGRPGDGDPDFLSPDEQLNGRPPARPAARAGGGGPRQGDRLPPPPRAGGAGGGRHTRQTPEPGRDDFDDAGDLADPFAE